MKDTLFKQTSCVILSAGSSVRMGKHKAFLKFDNESNFLQKTAEVYCKAGIEQVIVVVNSELFELISQSNLVLSEQVKLVVNDKPELGRFYSLQTGLKLIRAGNSCFFQNIDNPFISRELLHELINHKAEAEVIIPVVQKQSGHPVLIKPLVVQKINESRNYEVRIDVFLKQFIEKKIETQDQKILININSEEDYLKTGLMV